MTSIRSSFWIGALACAVATAAAPAIGQTVTPSFLATIGTDAVPGTDNAHFNNPASVAVDTTNGHILVVDQTNERIQIFNLQTRAFVATLGATGVIGSDNAHFFLPQGVAFDATHDRILVADGENERVQIFNAATLAYVTTLGVTGTQKADNTGFDLPTDVAYDPAHDEILVVDQNNDRVQVFNGTSFAYVATIGQTGNAALGPGLFAFPAGIDIDTVNNHILVADQGNNQVQILTAGSFGFVTALGDANGNPGTAGTQFNQPNGVAFDQANHHILVADFNNDRVQILDAASFAVLGTIGQTSAPGTGDASLNGPTSAAVDPASGDIFIVDAVNQRVQVFTQPVIPESLASAVLPGSRSVEIGATATVFGVMLNTAAPPLSNCTISLPSTAPAGLKLAFQTTSPANLPTGTPNTPATIAGNGSQNFLLSFTSASAFAVPKIPLVFGCTGSQAAPSTPGVNTVDLLFSATPIADIIALAATPTDNGIVAVPTGGSAAFAVASINAGAAGTVTVGVDTGSVTLPLTVNVCATNPTTGACLAAPTPSLTHSYQPNTSQTYSVFLTASAPIALAPATARVFLRFLDTTGASHGSTSVAVETN
jgi:DNA-binding beta-propeller fold protein YncE